MLKPNQKVQSNNLDDLDLLFRLYGEYKGHLTVSFVLFRMNIFFLSLFCRCHVDVVSLAAEILNQITG